jgi:predicted ArsR family transcriptional regulator
MTGMSDTWVRDHARTSDPDTSFSAAASVEGIAPRHMKVCFAALAASAGGLTSQEIADATGLDHWAVTRRVADLKNAGSVEDSGVRRKNRSGRSAAVWRVVSKQLEMFEND